MSAEPIITIRGLRNSFGDQVIHEDLDLDVRRGEILGVVGGSGTGKTTLLRQILGLETPARGTITLLGRPVSDLGERGVVDLDEDRKAAMVSNLMVVLCADREAQPVINTGTIYQ